MVRLGLVSHTDHQSSEVFWVEPLPTIFIKKKCYQVHIPISLPPFESKLPSPPS